MIFNELSFPLFFSCDLKQSKKTKGRSKREEAGFSTVLFFTSVVVIGPRPRILFSRLADRSALLTMGSWPSGIFLGGERDPQKKGKKGPGGEGGSRGFFFWKRYAFFPGEKPPSCRCFPFLHSFSSSSLAVCPQDVSSSSPGATTIDALPLSGGGDAAGGGSRHACSSCRRRRRRSLRGGRR